LDLPSGYADLLGEIKRLIQTERLRTFMAANAAVVCPENNRAWLVTTCPLFPD